MTLTPNQVRILSNLEEKHSGEVSIHSGEVMSLINVINHLCPNWRGFLAKTVAESVAESIREEFGDDPGLSPEAIESDPEHAMVVLNGPDGLGYYSQDHVDFSDRDNVMFSFGNRTSEFIRRFMTASYEGLENAKKVGAV